MIMPISTRGIGNVDISSASASKAKSKAEEKAMDAFASLMNMTASVSNDVQTEITKEIGVNQTEEISATEYASDYEDTYEVDTNKYETKETETADNLETENAKETETVNSTSKQTDNKQESIDTAAEALNELKKVIMTELDVTEEELASLLESMNLNLEDLMDVSNLKNFILNSKGCTNVDLLINENLSALVNNMTNKLDAIIQNYDLTDISEFIGFVEENRTEIYSMVEVETETVTFTSNTEVSVEVADTDENSVITQKEPKVEVNINNTTEESTVTETSQASTSNHTSQEGYQQSSDNTQHAVVNNLNQAVNNAFTANGLEAVSTYTNGVSEADIVRQIIDEIRVNVTKDTTSMEVQLNPEHLGKVQINVASKDGIIQAQIIAENEAAKHAIENSIAVLKETFNNQELKVEAIEVMVASYEFFNQGQDAEFNNEDQTNNSKSLNGINLNDGLSEDNLSDDEQLQVEIMRKQGSSVSYSI